MPLSSAGVAPLPPPAPLPPAPPLPVALALEVLPPVPAGSGTISAMVTFADTHPCTSGNGRWSGCGHRMRVAGALAETATASRSSDSPTPSVETSPEWRTRRGAPARTLSLAPGS